MLLPFNRLNAFFSLTHFFIFSSYNVTHVRCLDVVKNGFIDGINFWSHWCIPKLKTNNMRSNIYYQLQCKQFLYTYYFTKYKCHTLYHAPFSIRLEWLSFPFVLLQMFLPNHFPWCVINLLDVLTNIIEQLVYYVALHHGHLGFCPLLIKPIQNFHVSH